MSPDQSRLGSPPSQMTVVPSGWTNVPPNLGGSGSCPPLLPPNFGVLSLLLGLLGSLSLFALLFLALLLGLLGSSDFCSSLSLGSSDSLLTSSLLLEFPPPTVLIDPESELDDEE